MAWRDFVRWVIGVVLVSVICNVSAAKKKEPVVEKGGWASYGIDFDGYNAMRCNLFFLYDRNKGSIQGEASNSVCTVEMPREVSSERFDGCYLSGMQINGDGVYGCNVREIDGSWFFRAAYKGNPGTISCEYICKIKESGR